MVSTTGAQTAQATADEVTASDFTYSMHALAKVNVAACTGPATDVTDEPFYSNSDCGYAGFTLSGPATTVKAKFFLEDATTPFATEDATADPLTAGAYRVQIEPPAAWPAGRIRMQVLADGEPAGESTFGQELLGATFDEPATTFKPGQDIAVTGRVVELDNDSVEGLSDKGVPATFSLKTRLPDGSTVNTQSVTAGDDGTFSATIPGRATSGVETGADVDFTTVLSLSAVNATYKDGLDTWEAKDAGAGSATVVSAPQELQLENSFVSSVGWVKPSDGYPSRVFVRNPTDQAFTGVSVTVPSPDGATITKAKPASGDASISGGTVTWTVGSIPAATDAGPTVASLVLESEADTLAEDPQLVWKDLSSTATLNIAGDAETSDATSHGPRVIPQSETYDTARYGDRPFPVVPVDYLERKHQPTSSGEELSEKINSPADEGSTLNLFQEMSLGQLFPNGTVPSADIATADFDYEPGFEFTQLKPAGTCHGATLPQAAGTALYAERIKDGFYQLPGSTDYYGDDKTGSAVVGSLAGVGALADIDSACGPTGKLVYDSAAIADPEIDYSDYDTDKDGVVDFFMVVFAGCGGNGASQLTVLACPYTDAPYDNVWPHSSSLEFYYTDPETGLPGYTTDDQLRDLENRPLYYTDETRTTMTTTQTQWKVFVRVGPYNVNPETAIDKASVISHEYGHSLGLPDFYSTGGRDTYGDWNLMATDKSQNMDVFSRQEMGWIVPEVLEPGTKTTVNEWTDSKQDTHKVHWQTQDGTPYTLTGPRVHNAKAYVAKLPGRQLIDPAKFETGDKASATHAWWSGSGNDFGCPPTGGHNLDVAIPGLEDLPEGSTVQLDLKSLWDIEWDYDYGFVLTSTDGGGSYTSHPSENGYTTTTNPNQNACQGGYSNGLTGSSGSHQAGTQETDRLLGSYEDSVFLADSYDISDLAGSDNGVLRFAYATDPGLARPGWFIDDLLVTATTPGGVQILLDTDLEGEGGPDDPRIYNGGCRQGLTVAKTCTKGWNYVDSSSESPADHAYYMELRDRSGFDKDSNGQNDRDPLTFEPGLSLVYTDEAHGYGNAGTDNPPAQSPLDATPEPGGDTPELKDAAFTDAAARAHFTDSGAGHTDNYSNPAETSTDERYPDVTNPWRFQYGCLAFDVLSMTGREVGPDVADGDLTGDVAFDMGSGCGQFDYGYVSTTNPPPAPAENTAPVAKATATPQTVRTGKRVTLSAKGTTDEETPDDLDYSWDFGDDDQKKDGSDVVERTTYEKPGAHTATLTVTDPQGLTDTAEVNVVAEDGPAAENSPPTTAKAGRVSCGGNAVDRTGSWRNVDSSSARGGRYCDNLGRRKGRDTMTLSFTGPRVVIGYAKARRGGSANVVVDGERVGTVSFDGRAQKPRFGFSKAVTGLGGGTHTVRLVIHKGAGYVDDFVIWGRSR